MKTKKLKNPNLDHVRPKHFLCDRLYHTTRYDGKKAPRFEKKELLIQALNGAEAAAMANEMKTANDDALGWCRTGA